jgi:transposase
MKKPSYLGLDISKASIHTYLILAERQPKRKVVENSATGHAELMAWLMRYEVGTLHACMEATSTYGHGIARVLHAAGYTVSIGNPKAIHAYGESRMFRTKTDAVDARLIAEYCRDHSPHAWTPPSPEVEQLQTLVRRVQALEQMIIQEKNRQETVVPDLAADIQAHIVFMETQKRDLWEKIRGHIDQHPDLRQQTQLLDSIPGIGPESAARMIAEIGDWTVFQSARQLAAYVGITPQEKSSGTSVRGKTRVCKLGNARLRKALFFPAMTLLRWHADIQRWREHLLERGKTKKQVVGAVMHKLIRWVFGVLHSGKPFDPSIAFPASQA